MTGLLSRARRLERAGPLALEGECPRPQFGALVLEGNPLPDLAVVPPCGTCGGKHFVVERLVVVEPTEREINARVEDL
jgi:hypothetical protein